MGFEPRSSDSESNAIPIGPTAELMEGGLMGALESHVFPVRPCPCSFIYKKKKIEFLKELRIQSLKTEKIVSLDINFTIIL